MYYLMHVHITSYVFSKNKLYIKTGWCVTNLNIFLTSIATCIHDGISIELP